MIAFAVFHVALSQETIRRIIKRHAGFTPFEPNVYLNILFKTAKMHHPDCRCIVLTDEFSQFKLDGGIEIIRFPVDAGYPSSSRLDAQMLFLEHLQESMNVLFLDSDMLINSNLDSLFDGTFDLALTFRRDKAHVINGGFLGIANGKTQCVRHFFSLIKKNTDEYFQGFKRWWGDQLALDKVLGHDSIIWQESNTIEKHGIRIRLLPDYDYNYTPKTEKEALDYNTLSRKKVLHYKGLRKVFMISYWERYLKK